VVSSTDTDTYSALASAAGSLKGPKHGGANQRVVEMLDDMKREVKDWKDDDEVRRYLRRQLDGQAFDRSGLIYGMGHAVYTLSDPRARILKERARVLAEQKGRVAEFELAESVERLAPEVFQEKTGTTKTLCANVDLYSGQVYALLGIPASLYTPLFAIARVPGWCAHRIEELVSGGKVIRPAYKSVLGKSDYVPLAAR
jgi:citrate synthase